MLICAMVTFIYRYSIANSGWLVFVDRSLFYHREAVTAVVVFHLIHYVVDKQHSAARRFEQVVGVERVGDRVDIKTFAFVFDGKARLGTRNLGGDADEFCRIEFITVLDGVDERLVESYEKV